jgi:CDP-diacylglycerol---glycerol-3-phosphate 3-phosphatidyltransferase
MKHLANIITINRIILSIIIAGLYTWNMGVNGLLLFLFFLASLSDFLDGYLARKYNFITEIGKILDTVADKILSLAAYYIIYKIGLLPLPAILYFVVKEIGITLYRLKTIHATRIYIPSLNLGKIKTAYNLGAFFVLLVVLFLIEHGVIAEIPLIVNIIIWLTIF